MAMLATKSTTASSNLSLHDLGNAVDYAFALVKDWPDKERSGIEKAMKDLKELIEHNKAVLLEARDERKRLHEIHNTNEHLHRQAQKMHSEALALRDEVANEVAQKRAQLEADQRAFKQEQDAKNAAMRKKEAELSDREAKVRERETKVEQAQRKADEAAKKADRAFTDAMNAKQAAERKVAKLEEALKA